MARIISSSFSPAGPMNGRPTRSSGSPGTSPTNMISASGAPSPKTSLPFAPANAHSWHVVAWRDSISAKRATRSSRELAGTATTARTTAGACTTSFTCTTARCCGPLDTSRVPCNGRGDTSRPSARSKRASTAWTVNGSGMNRQRRRALADGFSFGAGSGS